MRPDKKKKEKKMPAVSAGFGVVAAASAEEKRKLLVWAVIGFLTVCLYSYGVMLLLCDITLVPLDLEAVLPITGMLGGAVFAAWFAFLFRLGKSRQALVFWIITAVVSVGAVLFSMENLLVGTQMLWYGVVERAYDVMRIRLPEWEFGFLTLYAAQNGAAALFAAIAAVTAFLGTAAVTGLRRLIPYIVLILPPMLGCYYLMEETADGVFCILLVSLFGMLGVTLLRRFPERKKAAKKAAFTVQGGTGRASGAVLAVGAAAVILVTAVLPRAVYVRPAVLREFMQDPFGTVERFLVGAVSSAVAPAASGGLSGGELGNVDAVEFENTERLRVENLPKRFDSFFLKGYTGAYYDGDSFDEIVVPGVAELAASLPEGETLYKTALSSAQNVTAIYGAPDDWELVEIRKTHIADLRIYAPYFIRKVSPSLREFYDYELDSDRGILRYGYFDEDYAVQIPLGIQDFGGPALSDITPNDALQIQRYAETENIQTLLAGKTEEGGTLSAVQQYTKIAYENYLQLPADGRFNWMTEYFAEADTLSEIFRAVEDLVGDGTSYTRSPGRTPDGADFVNHFLLESKQGYCAHFAAATVVAFRAAGVPARYCEGYVVHSKDRVGDTVVVKDSRAHAWCEIYMENIGWVPVDFTPADAAGLTTAVNNENSAEAESASDEEYSHPIAEESEESFFEPIGSADSSKEESNTPGGLFGGGADGPGGVSIDLRFLEPFLRGAVYVLAVGGAAVLLAGVLILRKNRVQKRRNARLRMQTAADVCAVYGDLLALWRYAGIVPQPGESDASLAARADGKFPFEAVTAADALAIAERARFADLPPDGEECARLRHYYKSLRRKILRGLKGRRRFVFEWLRRL